MGTDKEYLEMQKIFDALKTRGFYIVLSVGLVLAGILMLLVHDWLDMQVTPLLLIAYTLVSLVVSFATISLFFWIDRFIKERQAQRAAAQAATTPAPAAQAGTGNGTQNPVPPNGDVPDPIAKKGRFWWIIGLWFGGLVITLYVTSGFDVSNFPNLATWQQVISLLCVVWLAMSVHVIPLDKVAAVTAFGTPIKNIGPGPKLLPWLILEVVIFSRTVQQRQFPGNPEEVFKGEDREPLPKKMVRPLRVVTGAPQTTDDNPLNIQMALEFLYFLRVQINDPITFIIQFGSIEEFWEQMRDTGDRIITNKVSTSKGVADLVANLQTLMDELKQRFYEVADEGGIKIIESGLSAPDFTHSLSVAMRNIGVKNAEARQIKIIAEAEKEKLTKEGEGRAAAEAALIGAIKGELVNADPATIATYAGKKVLGDKTIILGTDGIAQAFGLGKAIMRGDET